DRWPFLCRHPSDRISQRGLRSRENVFSRHSRLVRDLSGIVTTGGWDGNVETGALAAQTQDRWVRWTEPHLYLDSTTLHYEQIDGSPGVTVWIKGVRIAGSSTLQRYGDEHPTFEHLEFNGGTHQYRILTYAPDGFSSSTTGS